MVVLYPRLFSNWKSYRLLPSSSMFLMMRPVVTDLGNEIPSSSSCRPVKISYGCPSNKPTNATHFSLLFWKRTTSASSTLGRTSTTVGGLQGGSSSFLSFLSFLVESKTPEREPSR